jgi:hypothetical protein
MLLEGSGFWHIESGWVVGHKAAGEELLACQQHLTDLLLTMLHAHDVV